MQIGALIALLRAVTLPFLASISAVFESRLARSLRAAVAIRAPICLTQTSEFLSLMNPLLTQMSGESASVEIQASRDNETLPCHFAEGIEHAQGGRRE